MPTLVLEDVLGLWLWALGAWAESGPQVFTTLGFDWRGTGEISACRFMYTRHKKSNPERDKMVQGGDPPAYVVS